MNEFRDRGGAGGLPASLADLPWAPGESYLGLPLEALDFEDCPVVVN